METSNSKIRLSLSEYDLRVMEDIPSEELLNFLGGLASYLSNGKEPSFMESNSRRIWLKWKPFYERRRENLIREGVVKRETYQPQPQERLPWKDNIVDDGTTEFDEWKVRQIIEETKTATSHLSNINVEKTVDNNLSWLKNHFKKYDKDIDVFFQANSNFYADFKDFENVQRENARMIDNAHYKH